MAFSRTGSRARPPVKDLAHGTARHRDRQGTSGLPAWALAENGPTTCDDACTANVGGARLHRVECRRGQRAVRESGALHRDVSAGECHFAVLTCLRQPYQPLPGESGVEGYCGGVGSSSMVGGEPGRRDASATAVWTHLAVVAAPLGDDIAELNARHFRRCPLASAWLTESRVLSKLGAVVSGWCSPCGLCIVLRRCTARFATRYSR